MIKEKSGTTLECLEHYFGTLPTSQKKIRRARQPFCDFVRCTHETAASWRAKRSEPIALSLVLTRLFLQDHGYTITELKDADPLVVRCSRAIAIGATTLDRVHEVMGYANIQDVFCVLQHRKNPYPERAAKLKAHLDEVFPKKSSEKEALRVQTSSDASTRVESVRAESCAQPRALDSPPRPRKRAHVEEGAIADAFAHSVLAMLPMANFMLSDDVNDEERGAFRKRFTHGELFDLANKLFGLCSKQARNDYLEETDGKL